MVDEATTTLPAEPVTSYDGDRRSHVPATLSLVVAVVLALVAAGAGYLVVDRRDPTYLATASTLLDQPKALAASQDAGVIDKLGRLRFKYAGILRSDAVLDPVATELGIPAGELPGRLVTAGDDGSLLLLIGARGTDRREAVRTANALARQLAAYIDTEQATNGVTPVNRLTLQVVAPARGARIIQPTERQRYVAAAGAGLVVLVVSLGVADLLRRRRP
jgi:capsular polysaccharide biosynthesis protein